MLIVKVLSMSVSFLYVPLLLHSLDAEQYGVWLTLVAMLSWISLFDIGLGNGLRNKLAEAVAIGDYISGRQYVSTSYCVIAVLSIILILIFVLVFRLFDWNVVLNATTMPSYDLDVLVVVVFVSFVMQFFLGIINSVLYALQVPSYVAILNFIGQFFSFIIVLILVHFFDVNKLLPLGIVISLVPVIVLLIGTFVVFGCQYPQFMPSVGFFKKEKIKDILTIGLMFFVIQIITIVLFQANNLIISHTINNVAVVEYNIAYKYMYILVSIFTLVCMPMWSATTDAFVKGDILWISLTRAKLFRILMFFIFIGILMLVFSEHIYCFWLGNDCPQIAFSTTFLLFLYSIFMMIYAANGYIINGIGKLKIQILFTSLLAVLYIPFALLLGKIGGLEGILIVLCINALVNGLWSSVQLNKIIKGTAHGIWNK